jgi:hypothetical protein
MVRPLEGDYVEVDWKENVANGGKEGHLAVAAV